MTSAVRPVGRGADHVVKVHEDVARVAALVDDDGGADGPGAIGLAQVGEVDALSRQGLDGEGREVVAAEHAGVGAAGAQALGGHQGGGGEAAAVALAAQHGGLGVGRREAVDEEDIVNGDGAEAKDVEGCGHGWGRCESKGAIVARDGRSASGSDEGRRTVDEGRRTEDGGGV